MDRAELFALGPRAGIAGRATAYKRDGELKKKKEAPSANR